MTESAIAQIQAPGNAPLGTLFHAPHVRLLNESGDEPVLLPAESGGLRPHPVHADIEKAMVTQVNHGPSQVSITFNNQRHEGYSRAQAGCAIVEVQRVQPIALWSTDHR